MWLSNQYYLYCRTSTNVWPEAQTTVGPYYIFYTSKVRGKTPFLFTLVLNQKIHNINEYLQNAFLLMVIILIIYSNTFDKYT